MKLKARLEKFSSVKIFLGQFLLHRMRIGRGNTANFFKSLSVFSGRKSLSQGLQSPSNI